MAVAILLIGLNAAGCGTQARWVNCEGRLEPINRQAPRIKDEPPVEQLSPHKKEQTAR
jgi:hypothetical protein